MTNIKLNFAVHIPRQIVCLTLRIAANSSLPSAPASRLPSLASHLLITSLPHAALPRPALAELAALRASLP
jgi:hypothetical protein